MGWRRCRKPVNFSLPGQSDDIEIRLGDQWILDHSARVMLSSHVR